MCDRRWVIGTDNECERISFLITSGSTYSHQPNERPTGRSWLLKLFACYQQSDKDYYRLPEIISYADFNINGHLKALELQFGVVGWYFSSYFANTYDPALNQFYLQNEKMIGNYPYFDFYIHKIQKTELMVELMKCLIFYNSQ